MLQFLSLKKYRSHEDIRLDFVPGVNVITPQAESALRNNIGKTNFIRALDLVVNNRPLGGRFFSDFAGDKGTTEIEIGVEGNTISLTKDIVVKDGKKIVKRSGYRIGSEECKDDYGALKGGIPDKIKRLLNFSELNIQNQHDGPFLICSSPGEVAKTFNRITKLEKVDQWVSSLTTRINTGNKECGVYEKQLSEQEAELEQYRDLLDIEKEVQKAERLQSRIEVCNKSIDDVSLLLLRLEAVEEKLVEWRSITAAGPLVDKILVLLNRVKEKERKAALVRGLLGRLGYVEEQLQRCRRITKAKDLVDGAHELFDRVKEKAKDMQSINSLITRFNQVTSKITDCSRRKQKLIGEYVAMLKKLGRCPICFTKVDQGTLDRIIGTIN